MQHRNGLPEGSHKPMSHAQAMLQCALSETLRAIANSIPRAPVGTLLIVEYHIRNGELKVLDVIDDIDLDEDRPDEPRDIQSLTDRIAHVLDRHFPQLLMNNQHSVYAMTINVLADRIGIRLRRARRHSYSWGRA